MSPQQGGTALLQSLSDAVAELAERVSASVVTVGNGRRWGTGFVWSKEGHIVTANHVVGRAETLHVRLNNGTELDAKVMGRDSTNDVALLKIERSNGLVPLETIDGDGVRSGQLIFAFANPMGQRPSVTSGIVTSPSRNIRGWYGVAIENAVITDAQLNPGYSGGPLVDVSGKLVGMNVAYFSSRGIAVASETLKQSVSSLSDYGKIRRGYLGIIAEPIELPEELASKAEIGQESGLLVRSVEDDTPAKASGLTLGDIIVKLGDNKLEDLYDLQKVLTDKAVGATVSLWVLRGGKPTELKITPKEADE
jgi:S1-C subfamily serine protease